MKISLILSTLILSFFVFSSAAAARDTNIYQSTTYAGSTAEPAIMLILDTSDSMNATEGWREYPGAYDSHVEYLWNDITVISNSEVPAASATSITTAAAPVLTKYGSWAGETLAQRQALGNAAKAYANATEPGDPGARNTYRNYKDARWIYWLPAGTDESDKAAMQSSTPRTSGSSTSETTVTRPSTRCVSTTVVRLAAPANEDAHFIALPQESVVVWW